MVVQYADDTNFSKWKKAEFDKVISKLERVLETLELWFRANGLKLNTEKTQLMVLGVPQNLRNLPQCIVRFNGCELTPVPEAAGTLEFNLTVPSAGTHTFHSLCNAVFACSPDYHN